MGFLSKVGNFATGGLLGVGNSLKKGLMGAEEGYGRGIDEQKRMFDLGYQDLAPYRDFGKSQISGLENFVSGNPWAPTMDQVTSQPGYQTRMGAVENSAAARGSLFSGNALRDISDFGASEYDSLLNRNRAQLNDRMGLVNIGYGAASGGAGLAMNSGNALAQLYAGEGKARTDRYGLPLQLLAGAAGAAAGRK